MLNHGDFSDKVESRPWNAGSQRLLGCTANHNNEPYLLTSAGKTRSALQEPEEPETRIQLPGLHAGQGRGLLVTRGSSANRPSLEDLREE